MSEEDRTTSIRPIAIISDSESFHGELLAQFIEQQLGSPCSLFKSKDRIPEDIELVLLDCFQNAVDVLNRCLRDLSTSNHNFVTALLNAEHSTEHENLLDWPCVSGLFYVDTSKDQLLRGMQQLLEGDYWVPRRLLHHFFNKHRQASNRTQPTTIPLIQLTNREKEILRMIKNGMSNSAVSDSLALSEHTVKSHLYNIYKKIGVRNRMEASNWARDQDLDSF